MIRIPARERLLSLAGSVVLAVIVIRQEARSRAERDRPIATVTNIESHRKGTQS